MQIKRCNHCGLYKAFHEFYKSNGRGKFGLRSKCKKCIQGYEKTPERIKGRQRYKKSNKGKETSLKYSRTEKARDQQSRYRKSEKGKESAKRHYESSVKRHISSRLRIRLNKVLAGKIKKGSAISDLGCPVDELISHLEKKFKPGMNWDNRSLWHIDHIRPLSSFDLEDRAQLKEACHYTNLQPLWAEENMIKGDRHEGGMG